MQRTRAFHGVSPFNIFLKKYGPRLAGMPRYAYLEAVKKAWYSLSKEERAETFAEAKATPHFKSDPYYKPKKKLGLSKYQQYLHANAGKLAMLSPADKLTLMLQRDGWKKVKAKVDNSVEEVLSCEMDRLQDAALDGADWDYLTDPTAEFVIPNRETRHAGLPMEPPMDAINDRDWAENVNLPPEPK
jgi:hypothetical protein